MQRHSFRFPIATLLWWALLYGSGAGAAAPSVTSKQYALTSLPIVARVKVLAGPGWLETGFGSVWVSRIDRKCIMRIDPATNRVVARIPAGSDPEGIVAGLGFIWVADVKGHSILQLDPKSNRVIRTIAVQLASDAEGTFGLSDGSLWVITDGRAAAAATLTRVDVTTGKIIAEIPVNPDSHGVVSAFGAVWVSSAGAGTVTRIDTQSNAVVAQIPVHSLPRFVIASESGLWVLSQSDGSLTRIDPRANQVVAVIDLGVPGDGGDLSVSDGFVWVGAEGVPLSQIDPRSNQLQRQFVGGVKDDTMRVAFGSVWILLEQQGEIWRADLQSLLRLPPPR